MMQGTNIVTSNPEFMTDPKIITQPIQDASMGGMGMGNRENVPAAAHLVGKHRNKDIRETELYQENFPGARVHEGGALAGMPISDRPMM